MSRLICVLALLATLTNVMVWSMDVIPHLLASPAPHAVTLTEAEPAGEIPSTAAYDDDSQDIHHCCHLDSHLDAPHVVVAMVVNNPDSALNEPPLSAPANGFFRSPFRPPSV